MILTCPACSRHYNADASKFPPEGRSVRCANCGHVWHQDPPPPDPVLDPDPGIFADPPPVETAAAPEQPFDSPQPPPDDDFALPAQPGAAFGSEPEPEPAAETTFAVETEPPEEFPAEPLPESEPETEPAAGEAVEGAPEDDGLDDYTRRRRARAAETTEAPDAAPAAAPRAGAALSRGIVLGWVLLVAIILGIGWVALAYRQEVMASWPQSASLYSALGMKSKTSGLAFGDYSFHLESEQGQPVLSVTGMLRNTSAEELPVPPIRASLQDEAGREIYHWNFSTDVLTLKPGQSTRFVTRLSNPPPAARELGLRFAKAGE
jgi:predicted Zn finger-like uncharacterized protein